VTGHRRSTATSTNSPPDQTSRFISHRHGEESALSTVPCPRSSAGLPRRGLSRSAVGTRVAAAPWVDRRSRERISTRVRAGQGIRWGATLRLKGQGDSPPEAGQSECLTRPEREYGSDGRLIRKEERTDHNPLDFVALSVANHGLRDHYRVSPRRGIYRAAACAVSRLSCALLDAVELGVELVPAGVVVAGPGSRCSPPACPGMRGRSWIGSRSGCTTPAGHQGCAP
jgi:hypothetical protein